MYGIYHTCKKCRYKSDWKNCPGFGPLYRYLEENELPNYLESLKKRPNFVKPNFKDNLNDHNQDPSKNAWNDSSEGNEKK